MTKKAPTVAIALFVKNEFSDIKGWIAWHLALGVNTLFIFDDHSSDGTWEILEAAAKCFDIRLFRTDPISESNFYWRQKKSYLQAVEECKGKYDWLGFLDGDEYLYIKHFDNVSDFFYRFDHADAIAFSWRIYGHSKTVIRPKLTAVESFLEHSTSDFGDNHMIKTFLRPEKLKGNYQTPHWFYDIDVDRYVRPHGGKVNEPGVSQEVDWSDAFVMHYLCRSMEHFVERIKKRQEITDYWVRFDCSDLMDVEPLRFVKKMNDYLIVIHKMMLKDAINRLSNLPYKSQNIFSNYNISFEKPSVYFLKTFFNTYMYYDPSSKLVVHATEESANQNGFLKLIGLIYPSTPNIITFQLLNDDVPYLKMQKDSPVYNKLFFRLNLKESDQNSLLVLSGDMYHYTCFTPPDDVCGQLCADRLIIGEYEKVVLEYVCEGKDHMNPCLPFDVYNITNVDSIVEWVAGNSDLSEDQFLRVMYALSPSVRDYISKHIVPGLLWPFI